MTTDSNNEHTKRKSRYIKVTFTQLKNKQQQGCRLPIGVMTSASHPKANFHTPLHTQITHPNTSKVSTANVGAPPTPQKIIHPWDPSS